MTASRSPRGSNFSNCVFVPCAQRVVQVCATTTEDALWKPADGTASASQAGEGPGVTSPWKRCVQTARTMKEVCLSPSAGCQQSYWVDGLMILWRVCVCGGGT